MNVITSDKMPALPGGYFFNDPKFHGLKEEKGLFYGLQVDGKIAARLSFYLKEGEAQSGYKAPFGALDFLKGTGIAKIEWFINEVITDLKRHDVVRALVKLPPGYINEQIEVEQALEKNGFVVQLVEVNQHITVEEEPFSEKISQKERNKLNRARVEGYRAKRLGKEHISLAFELINSTHGRKNYPVTMSEDEFQQAYDQVPGHYLLFGLYDQEDLIAVVASVLVSGEVMYNFYHADHEAYRSRSPLVMLIGETYEYCLENQLKILDLGISSVGGRLNEGLFRFKQNLGCEVAEKKTLTLKL